MQETFHVVYTVPGMRNWLQRHGFSYKKPALVPGKANKEQQEQWLAEYEKLRQELPKDETICFTDGVHPTHNVQSAYGWIKKGIRKEIPANTGRSRLNLSGAIDVVNHNVLIQEDQTLNAKSTIRFFQKIEEAYPHKWKIHVFCDNAPYYRNKEVREYLKNSKTALHFLPPYSPNLNPIERLWKWMKERVIYNTYYTENDSKVGNLARRLRKFFVWSERPLCKHKARVKTKNVLHSQRSQKPTFESFSVYEHFEEFKAAVLGFLAVLSTLSGESMLGKNFRSRIRDHFRPIGA